MDVPGVREYQYEIEVCHDRISSQRYCYCLSTYCSGIAPRLLVHTLRLPGYIHTVQWTMIPPVYSCTVLIGWGPATPPFPTHLSTLLVSQDRRHLFVTAWVFRTTGSFIVILALSLTAVLQMKSQWESNINVWFPFMYSQKWNCYFQNRIIMFCLSVPSLIYMWEIYIFPGSVCLFCCREICGPILGIYKSLTDTWMSKLGPRPRNSQKMGFSLQCDYCSKLCHPGSPS